MIGWRHSRPASHRGAVVVEFALIFILLVLLLLGAVEFGRAWYVVHMLSSAAREGARVGALLGEPSAHRVSLVSSRGWTTPRPRPVAASPIRHGPGA